MGLQRRSIEQTCFCCCIVPPRMLDRLATHGDPDVAAAAGRTLRLTASVSAFRAQLRTGAAVSTPVRTGLRRQVFDCQGTEDAPGDPARMEQDGPSADAAVNQAFGNAGTTYNFFKQVFSRESVDDHGRTLVSSVHYGTDYDNALWNGQQMIYGDGDGQVFGNCTAALEVVAHELTHGITQFTAQLPYQGQSGALNEHFSDVFGSLVKQWSLDQDAASADWLIGADVRGPAFQGRALRDMEHPGTAYDDLQLGKDPQPAHMKDYVQTVDDFGGVHTNSGIPNRAFVLAAKSLGGKAWSIAGKIWYVTLTERLTATADFEKCAAETISAARDLFPGDATIADRVKQAWNSVGLTVANVAVAMAAPTSAASVAPAPATTLAAVSGQNTPRKLASRRSKQPKNP